ncbi:MAG: hypothetical protein J5952_06245 [Prevotella sp.]|nr:hypothetical protein [Prevotella sp.]
MKRLLFLYGITMLSLCGMAQGYKNTSFLGRPTTGALPDSWFKGLSGGQIRHIKQPCGVLGNIPSIMDIYDVPIYVTLQGDSQANKILCGMLNNDVAAEFETLKGKEIPTSTTKECFISITSPLRPLRIYNYPTTYSYFPYTCIYFYAPYTLKNTAESFWTLKTLAIFISKDGYAYITDTILDGIDGMQGKLPGNVVVGVQVDWRSVYVMNNLSQVIFVHYLKDSYSLAKKRFEEWSKQATKNQKQRQQQAINKYSSNNTIEYWIHLIEQKVGKISRSKSNTGQNNSVETGKRPKGKTSDGKPNNKKTWSQGSHSGSVKKQESTPKDSTSEIHADDIYRKISKLVYIQDRAKIIEILEGDGWKLDKFENISSRNVTFIHDNQKISLMRPTKTQKNIFGILIYDIEDHDIDVIKKKLLSIGYKYSNKETKEMNSVIGGKKYLTDSYYFLDKQKYRAVLSVDRYDDGRKTYSIFFTVPKKEKSNQK